MTDEHVLEVGDGEWAIQHPLACRPDLLGCPVHRRVKALMRANPWPPQRYVLDLVEGEIVAREVGTGE